MTRRVSQLVADLWCEGANPDHSALCFMERGPAHCAEVLLCYGSYKAVRDLAAWGGVMHEDFGVVGIWDPFWRNAEPSRLTQAGTNLHQQYTITVYGGDTARWVLTLAGRQVDKSSRIDSSLPPPRPDGRFSCKDVAARAIEALRQRLLGRYFNVQYEGRIRQCFMASYTSEYTRWTRGVSMPCGEEEAAHLPGDHLGLEGWCPERGRTPSPGPR